MGNFGQYLLQKGVLDLERLDEAVQVMVVFGGRLGTILVESGLLTAEEVEKHLSAYLDLPCAPPERLAAIPRDVARRHSVLPLWIEKRTLHLAMLDARDPDLIDALAFATDLAIVPYVVSERRLVQLLERHYEIRPDPRFTDYRILEMAGHYRPVRKRQQPPKPETGGGAAGSAASRRENDALAIERAALGIAPLAEDEELSDPAEAAAAQPVSESIPAEPIELTVEVPSSQATDELRVTPARDVAELARLESELVLLAPRDRIAPLALRIATYFVRSAALFAVRPPMIQGVLAGGEVRTDRIEGIFLPLEAESVLSRVAASASCFRGRIPEGDIDAGVLRALHEDRPREIVVQPVCLSERTVNLIYADNGDEPLAETSLAALEALADIVSAAYRRLVLEGRRLLR
jgi:hypothetical protein